MANRRGKGGSSEISSSLGSKVTADGDSSHEIRGYLLLGRKAMINLDSVLKTRETTLLTKVCIVMAMVFPVVRYSCESWTIKKAEYWRIDASELWCWRRLLRVPWTARRSNQSILREINPEYSLEGLMLNLKLQPFHPLMPSFPSTLNLSQHQGIFRWVSCLHQMTKILEFSFSISLSNEYSGLISLEIDWLNLFAVQGTLRSLLQHHSSKASILWCSTFFMVQLSHLYMTNRKNTAFTLWTFVHKVMSLPFNTLSRFVQKKFLMTWITMMVWSLT